MNKRVREAFCIFLCGMLLFANGCAGIGNSHGEDRYLELVDSPSTTLDNVWYNPGGIFRCAVFEGLLTSNADMTELDCALAKDYTVSEDGLVYEFLLRDDVKWHDGEVFDEEDVEYSIKTALRTEAMNGILTSAFQYIVGADMYTEKESEELEGFTVSENKVTFTLTAPVGGFLSAIAQFAILPEHLLKDVAPDELETSDYWKYPIGCGCYKITEAVEGEYFILEANKEYYGKACGIKKIRLRTEAEDCVTMMENGELDFYVTNDPEEIACLKGIENCSEHELNILFPTYLIMNLSQDEGTNEYLKDAKVRQAILMAIDRNTIVDAIFPGSVVTNTLIPAWDSNYLQDAETYEFNPDKAKTMLEEAGFDFSKPLRLRYSTKGQSTKDLMNAIAVYLKAIGIQVDLQEFEGSGSEHMFHIRDYDICYKRLSAFDYATIYGEVHGDGIMQTSILGQPVYDELLADFEMTQDEEKRKEILQEMQQLDQEYLFRLPLFSLANIAYVNDNSFEMPEAYGNLWFRYDLRFSEWKLVN